MINLANQVDQSVLAQCQLKMFNNGHKVEYCKYSDLFIVQCKCYTILKPVNQRVVTR